MSFVHLHTHSHYSLLDGLSKIDDLIARAVSYKMPALALTDHGNLYGAIEFYKKCQVAGIKPIIGVEFYVAPRSRHDKEPHIDAKRYHLTVLAKNETGYKNLIKLVKISNLEGFYYKPRVDKESLKNHAEGLIALSGCLGGELSQALWRRNQTEAEAIIKQHQTIFGPDNYYLEIMHHPKIERQPEITASIIKLAKQFKIPLVATHDSHYLDKDDARAHSTLVAIQTNTDLADNRLTNKDEDFSFLSPAEAKTLFADTPEAIDNTIKIANRCQLELKLGSWVFPDYQPKDNLTCDQDLKQKTETQLKSYIKDHPQAKDEARQRVDFELSVIFNKGYSPYFLVVADLIDFAHQNKIFTNTRGSAAGSFVSYLLGITNVDPLTYNLPFERFLNAERPSPPDIDMDFADKRRDEVIDYARQKYGSDKVAQIGTFGSMMARGAVRDVARALGRPYSEGDRLARLIPIGSQGRPMTIDKALDLTPELKEIYDQEAGAQEIIDLAKKIEGCARHISVHAAGVVIAPQSIDNFVPIQFDPKGGKIITQYDMHAVEDIGLLKFDFLGIRNLSILEDSIRLVEKTIGDKVEIENIPLDDQKTFDLLARGETIGLFQLGGVGMTRWLKELRPTTIHDINAMVALYRPGPMESIPEYIKRKHDPTKISYLDERLKYILDKSFGIITYQDDVMLIAIKLAGYSWTEADKLRKAMGKKIPKEMEAQKEKLIKGLVANGLTEKKARSLWLLIEPFAAYGFNKSHAASYGRVAYQTAYMKANYPAEFMTAVLSAEAGDTAKIAEIIAECKRMKIPVLPPDINESFGDFTVVKSTTKQDKIRFGLFTIKNLGVDIAEAIVAERKENGLFSSLTNFLERIKHKNLNHKSLEALIKAGTFDSLGLERGDLLGNIEEALTYNREINQLGSQESLFSIMADKNSIPVFKLKPCPEIAAKEKLSWEKELLGLYLSGHPLEDYRDKFSKQENTIAYNKKLGDNVTTTIGGVIEEIKIINTKKGDPMAFVRLSDFTDEIEIVFFTNLFNQQKDILQPEKCLAVRGRLSRRNGDPSLIAEAVKVL